MKFGHNLAFESEFETVLYTCKESFFVGQFRGSKIFFGPKGPFQGVINSENADEVALTLDD